MNIKLIINDTFIEVTAQYEKEIKNELKSLQLLSGNNTYYTSIDRIIELTRLLCINLGNEEKLEVKYGNESITYVNKKIVEYSNGSITYNDKKITIDAAFKTVGNYEIQYFINRMIQLSNITYMELDKVSEHIIYAYQLFYGETPNFKNKSVEEKTQIMLYILSKVAYYFSNNFSSYFTKYQELPNNEYIKYEIDKLKAFNIPFIKNNPNNLQKMVQKFGTIITEENNLDLKFISKAFNDYYNGDKNNKIIKEINKQFKLKKN